MIRHIDRTDRADTINLQNVFAIAITAGLIVVLLTGATTALQNERTEVVDAQLETIGNQLAIQLERADELAQRGDNVTVRATVQRTVAGEDYSVRVAEGDDCVTNNYRSDSCLVLDALDLDAGATVPVNVSTDVTVRRAGGTVRIDASGGRERPGYGPDAERPIRLGVGRSFVVDDFATAASGVNFDPTADFGFSPVTPRVDDPTRFNATASFDQDGDVVAYKWDLDGDGRFDAKGENVSRALDPGPRNVTLEVVDDDGAVSNTTERVVVSGLTYNLDLDDAYTRDSSRGAISFTVTNEWPFAVGPRVSIQEVWLDPTNDDEPGRVELRSITTNNDDCSGDCPFGDDSNEGAILVNDGTERADENVGEVDSRFAFDGGNVIEIRDGGAEIPLGLFGNDDGNVGSVQISSGDTARVWVGEFPDQDDLTGYEFDIGVRYDIDDQRNATVFTDVVGNPDVKSVRLETGGGVDNDQVDAVIVSQKSLDGVEIEVDGAVDTTVDTSTTNPSELPSGLYEHRVFLGTATEGSVRATLTSATNNSGGANVEAAKTRGDRSVTRSAFLDGGDYVWQDDADWDAASTSAGVVHADYGTNDPDTVRVGTPARDQGGSNLVAFWPLDDTTDDVGPNDFEATPQDDSVVIEEFGAYGTWTRTFDGDDDSLEVTDGATTGSYLDTNTTDEMAVSMWVRKNSSQSDSVELLGRSDESYSLRLNDSDIPRFTIYDRASQNATAPTAIGVGEWHHLVGTFDGSTVRLYVDGQLVDETSADWITESGDPVRIAADPSGDENFDGKIDEVRLYNRSLTPSEIDRIADTKGQLVTDWQSGATIAPGDLGLASNASVPGSTSITVTVQADTDSDGAVDWESDPVALSDGANQVDANVAGAPAAADRFRLKVDISSRSVVKSPRLFNASVVDTS